MITAFAVRLDLLQGEPGWLEFTLRVEAALIQIVRRRRVILSLFRLPDRAEHAHRIAAEDEANICVAVAAADKPLS